jgi:hypothetical protein
MTKASYRNSRKNKAISKGSKIFSAAIQNKDYKTASQITYITALKVGGAKSIMEAMKNANDFVKRKELRNGL